MCYSFKLFPFFPMPKERQQHQFKSLASGAKKSIDSPTVMIGSLSGPLKKFMIFGGGSYVKVVITTSIQYGQAQSTN